MKQIKDRIELPDNFNDVLRQLRTPKNADFWVDHPKELAIVKEMHSRGFGCTQIANALFKFGYKVSRWLVENKCREMVACGKK